MPRVGSKSFAYSPKGTAAARKEAARTGKPMTNTKAGTGKGGGKKK